jgi:radical SAM modification target selenobiotic family peptide
MILLCNGKLKEKRSVVLLTKDEEVDMDKKDLKKLLAGLSIASLLTGAGLAVTGCATTA